MKGLEQIALLCKLSIVLNLCLDQEESFIKLLKNYIKLHYLKCFPCPFGGRQCGEKKFVVV